MKYCFEASKVTIIVNADPLEPTAAFPQLGRIVAFNNSDWVDLYQKLRKAWHRWGVVAKVLTRTGSTVQSRAMLYKVVV